MVQRPMWIPFPGTEGAGVPSWRLSWVGCVTTLLSRGGMFILGEYPRAPAEMLLADQASSPETGCYQPPRASVSNVVPLPPKPVNGTLSLGQNFKHE